MRLHFSPTTEAALLLVGLAVLHASTAQWLARPMTQEAKPAALMGPGQRMALQHCREHVAIIHDVYWAAACMRNGPDDSPECTLPDERAAPLNFARDAAEARCTHEARAGAHQ